MFAAKTHSPPLLRSCLYECRVLHQRFAPRRHRFEYGIFMLAVDLDELNVLHHRLRLFSYNRWNAYEFRDTDHLVANPLGGELKAQLRGWLADQGVALPADARVRLITLPRVLGYIFAPVSFYFCHTSAGTPIGAVAEVQNTFGELKPYFVPPAIATNPASPECFRVVVPKHYYVSPFSELELSFDFKLRTPNDRLEISVNDVSGQRTILISTLVGERRPLTDGQLLRLTAKYPLVTLRVITLIHWHALKLWWKRVPWHPKAANPQLQCGVFRPHQSLAGADVHPSARGKGKAGTCPHRPNHKSSDVKSSP